MLQIEDVRHCVNCEEQTPHLRHALPLYKLVGAAVLLAFSVFLLRGSELTMVGWGFVLLALLLYRNARRHPRHIHCNRCREKAQRALRRTQPTLDGHTTIDIL
ncbi:MAG: hypothetical protein ACI8QC_001339 [Planctomycetota bacterium]|jgi:hypothetical protein